MLMFRILGRRCAASRRRRAVGARGRCGRRGAARRRVGVLGVGLRGGWEGGEGDVGGDRMEICARMSFDSFCCREGKKKVSFNVRLGVFLFVGASEEGAEADAQDEVDMIAEEGTHDERECASGKGEH